MFSGKGKAGTLFEVFFKLDGLIAFFKRAIPSDFIRALGGGKFVAVAIMFPQSSF
jgi:hypothetical protein